MFFFNHGLPDNKSHSSFVPQAIRNQRSGTFFETDDINNEVTNIQYYKIRFR